MQEKKFKEQELDQLRLKLSEEFDNDFKEKFKHKVEEMEVFY